MKWINVLLIVFLVGCSEADGLNNVRRDLKTDEVVAIPNKSGSFIARKKDGSVWYAYSTGMSERVISQVMLFPPEPPKE